MIDFKLAVILVNRPGVDQNGFFGKRDLIGLRRLILRGLRLILYKLSSSSSSSSGSGNRPASSSGSFKIPTWLLVAAVLGIVSGDLPINGFTVILAVIMAVVVWIRIIS